MTDNGNPDGGDIGKFDPGLTQRLMAVMRPVLKTYFRSEVHGLDAFPPGGALVVGNHSGGMFPMDVLIFSVAFLRQVRLRPAGLHAEPRHPDDRPHRRLVPAHRIHPGQPGERGRGVAVRRGGDRVPRRRLRRLSAHLSENVIDFNGRKGYVRTAIEAGVPIVPAVSIGGQETQLYLTRGTWLAERLGIKRLLRSEILPLSFGFPFGLSAFDPAEPAAAHQDRDPGAGTHRHRQAVRRRPRRRRGRRVRAVGDAGGPDRPCRQASLPDPGLSHAESRSSETLD